MEGAVVAPCRVRGARAHQCMAAGTDIARSLVRRGGRRLAARSATRLRHPVVLLRATDAPGVIIEGAVIAPCWVRGAWAHQCTAACTDIARSFVQRGGRRLA